jgi:hypothetical protein
VERQDVVGTVAEFRSVLQKAKHTFMGCDCCGYLPVSREELLDLTCRLGDRHSVRWASVDEVPDSIVFLVEGI